MLNVAPEPAVNSQVYSHRPSAKQDQGGSADDFGSLVDSNAAAADHDVPSPSPQDRAARPADNNNDRPAKRDDRTDADPAEDAQQSAPRTGIFNQKAKKSPAHAVKTGLTEGKSKTKTKDEAADQAPADPSQTQQAAADAANPNAVVVATPAAAAQATAVKSDGTSDAAAATAASATDASAAAVAATSAKDAAAGTDAKAIATAAKPGVDPTAGHPSSDKSKAGQTQVPADGTATAKASDGANAAALSAGIVVPQQAAAAGASAVTTGVVKTEAVQGIGNGKSAKAATKTADAEQTDAKPGTGAKSTGNKPDASSADDANANQAKSDVASAKADKGAVPAAPAHDKHSADPQTAKPDVSFQTALDLQAPATTSQPQTQQQFTVTVAGPAASAQAASIPVPVNGLAVDIATRAAAGNTSFQIRLDPAELGRIDVRLDVDKHGRVTSHLTVDQPATLDMLRKDAPQLQRALEDAGLKTGDGGLQFSLRDQSPQGGQGDSGQGRQSHRLIVSEEISATPQVVGASYGRSSGSSSGVDISI